MSDKRLGGIENSSLRYFSAMRALAISISRIVKPSFSRRVRRLLPAGSIERLHWKSGRFQSGRHHSRERRSCHDLTKKICRRASLLRFPNGFRSAPRLRSRLPCYAFHLYCREGTNVPGAPPCSVFVTGIAQNAEILIRPFCPILG